MSERTFRASEAHKLEDPKRLTWLPPTDILSLLGLSQGMAVADIGAGTGYFALPIAKLVGPSGVVYAVDLQVAMLDLLREKLTTENPFANIRLVEGSASRTHLADNSVELAFLSNVWHELDDFASALDECMRILHKGGRIAILDWRPDVEQPPGPPKEHRISPTHVCATLASSGWTVKQTTNVGKYSYLVAATR